MSISVNSILLIDNEKYITEFLGHSLRKHGFLVEVSSNSKEAIQRAREMIPSVILVDLLIPGMNGIQTCIELRKIRELDQTAIALLSYWVEDDVQISGFEAGADDFIRKPVRTTILVPRLKALQKRIVRSSDKIITGDLCIDQDRFEVTWKGKKINLTRREFEILWLLIYNKGKIVNHEKIMNQKLDESGASLQNNLSVYIYQLRKKIDPDIIETVKGLGYRYRS